VISTRPFNIVPASALKKPAPWRGLGNLRSLVIFMAVIMAATFGWVAMVPQIREIS